MTRYFAFILAIFFTLTSTNSFGLTYKDSLSKKKSDSKFGGLNGRVKQTLEEHFKVEKKAGQVELGAKMDSTGRRIYLKKYDEKGNWIRTNGYGLENNLKTFMILQYDSLDNNYRSVIYKGDSALLRWTSSVFDNHGNAVEAVDYKPDSSVISRVIWKRDTSGRLTETLEYSSGTLTKRATYKYDRDGNETECCIYNSMNSLEGVYTKEYDSSGKKTEEKFYSKGKWVKKTVFKYDKSGNIIEEATYNSNGALLQKTQYKYEYDKQGNWIRRVEYVSDQPKFITTRKITYYEQ